MKKTYLILLKFVFILLNILSNVFNKESIFVKYKIAIGILILALKGYDTKAQVDISRTSCYAPGRYKTYPVDLSVSDRIPLDKQKDNTIMLKLAYRYRAYSPGISANYTLNTKTISIGPYFRYYPIEYRSVFLYFMELNYQIAISNIYSDELNITSGFVLFQDSRIVNIELACQYNITFSDNANRFIPVVGIHYFFSLKD